MPRLLRQAPLNSIWEGSGNIQCLDVLRALQREPACRDAFFAELQAASGGHALLDAEIVQLERVLAGDPAKLEGQSRVLAERMALALQAAILIRAGDAAISDSFCQSRLGTQHGLAFGTLPASAPIVHLLGRVWPA